MLAGVVSSCCKHRGSAVCVHTAPPSKAPTHHPGHHRALSRAPCGWQAPAGKYTYLDESDGKRYLRRYDALRLFVGYHKDRESALVQVTDITYNEGLVEFHLGMILERN